MARERPDPRFILEAANANPRERSVKSHPALDALLYGQRRVDSTERLARLPVGYTGPAKLRSSKGENHIPVWVEGPLENSMENHMYLFG